MTETLCRLWPFLVPAHPDIAAIHPVSESRMHSVWKITTQSGRTFAAKQHLFADFTRGKPFDFIRVEHCVSQGLFDNGCSVPRIVGADAERGLTIAEWRGDDTLDDFCQSGDPQMVAASVIDVLLALEAGFQKHASAFAPLVAPGCSAEDLKTAWLAVATPVADILPDFMAHLFGQVPNADLAVLWHNLIRDLAEAPPSLGPTDYNARNIVLDDHGRPSVIELSKIGYDWPERRLVQYTTGLGAHLPKGRIVGLLGPERAVHYAHRAAAIRGHSPGDVLARLDAHHFAFHIFAAMTCLNADADHPWKNTEVRLGDIRTALLSPLTRTSPADVLRNALGSTMDDGR
jgi:hypothetical protein